MAHERRLSESISRLAYKPTFYEPIVPYSEEEREQWVGDWSSVFARDILSSRIVTVDTETTVEDACELLLTEDIPCLAIKSEDVQIENPIIGLFDFSDVNTFLTLAATRHLLLPGTPNSRADEIIAAAREGKVPVKLVSNLSEKNPLRTLPHDATILSLLQVFSTGAHRVLIEAPFTSTEYVGMVSDTSLLQWFFDYGARTPSIQSYFQTNLHFLELPSLDLYNMVVSCSTDSTVLHAMKLMSEEGVSGVAVIDTTIGNLLSAITVTDIAKVVVPSQNNQILSTSLGKFISYIKHPHGSTDGADRYPVYSVSPTCTLSYTIQKLIATRSHRLFVKEDVPRGSSPVASQLSTDLIGIVSVVDILSLFARLAQIPDVDPTRMQRHRRASSSSASSGSSRSGSISYRGHRSSKTGRPSSFHSDFKG